ncbi:MAG TPA: hypothetical protein VN858_01180 [Casimicrobiaceae bacterium]|nr:hypothetical protein [Casimicrobiaceae bacterium]
MRLAGRRIVAPAVFYGEGQIDVIRQEAHNRYVSEASIATAPPARTGLFVAAERTLYVAAPAVDGRSAHLDVYRVE